MKCHMCDQISLWMIKTVRQQPYKDPKEFWICIRCFKNELMKDVSYE